MDYSRLFFELFNYFSFTFNPNPPLIWKLPINLLLSNLKLFVSMEWGRSMKLLRMILLPLLFWSLNKLAKRQFYKFCNFHSRLRVKTRQLKMRGDITLTGPAKVLRLAPRVLMQNIPTLRRPVAEPTPTYGLEAFSHTHTQNKTVWLHHMACTKSPTAVFFNPFWAIEKWCITNKKL